MKITGLSDLTKLVVEAGWTGWELVGKYDFEKDLMKAWNGASHGIWLIKTVDYRLWTLDWALNQ
jgi:hypothetical protein